MMQLTVDCRASAVRTSQYRRHDARLMFRFARFYYRPGRGEGSLREPWFVPRQTNSFSSVAARSPRDTAFAIIPRDAGISNKCVFPTLASGVVTDGRPRRDDYARGVVPRTGSAIRSKHL